MAKKQQQKMDLTKLSATQAKALKDLLTKQTTFANKLAAVVKAISDAEDSYAKVAEFADKGFEELNQKVIEEENNTQANLKAIQDAFEQAKAEIEAEKEELEGTVEEKKQWAKDQITAIEREHEEKLWEVKQRNLEKSKELQDAFEEQLGTSFLHTAQEYGDKLDWKTLKSIKYDELKSLESDFQAALAKKAKEAEEKAYSEMKETIENAKRLQQESEMTLKDKEMEYKYLLKEKQGLETRIENLEKQLEEKDQKVVAILEASRPSYPKNER